MVETFDSVATLCNLFSVNTGTLVRRVADAYLGERLTLRRGVQRQVLTLQAGPKDEFSVPGSTLRFRRDTNGAVTGLVVDAGRMRGVVFEKNCLLYTSPSPRD